MKQKIVSVALALGLVLSMAACGAGSSTSEATQQEQSSAVSETVNENESEAVSEPESEIEAEASAEPEDEAGEEMAADDEIVYDGEVVENSAPFQFSNRETVKVTMTVPEDGTYFILMPVQNYTGEEEKSVHITSEDLDFLSDYTIAAPAGIAGRFWTITELVQGTYTMTAEALDEGEYNIMLGLTPVNQVETFSGNSFQREEDGIPAVYTCTYDEPTAVDFTLTAAEGSMVAFFGGEDMSWMQTISVGEGETEAEISVEFPAGEAVMYFFNGSDEIVTAK